VETQGKVGIIRLNRPKALNALNDHIMDELGHAALAFDADDKIGCIVLTGSEKAFAAGADIGAMAEYTYMDVFKGNYISRNWEQLRNVRKPVIAAVAGYALGGGCELAMLCDFIIAADNAKFGQPEIKIGVMPGAGGTQRLTRAVGKALAMEMVLTGKFINAREAWAAGLINRVVPVEIYLQEALKLASQVAALSPIATQLAKESVLKAFDSALEEGLQFERKNFYLLFASEDQKEGMAAFVEKRNPNFSGK
jgi:enoyl-CoA hydratase